MAGIPKPTALKLLDGNPGCRPINKQEPKPQGTAKMPAGMDKETKAIWKKYAPRFRQVGLLTELDEQAFVMLCVAYHNWITCLELAKKDGIVIETYGGVTANPYLVRADKEADRVSKLLTQFGATPSARSKIQLDMKDPEKTKTTSLDSFLDGFKKAG